MKFKRRGGKRKIYHPTQNTPPHKHKWKETGSTARLGFRGKKKKKKKPGKENEAGLVLSFLSRFPEACAGAMPSTSLCVRVPSPHSSGVSLLLASTEVATMGARRYG